MKNKALKWIILTAYELFTYKMAKGPKISRYYMYRHLARFSEERDPEHKLLSISHSEKLAKVLGYQDAQITDVRYPDYNTLHLPFADAEYDAVVSDQVLEHVEGSPQDAVNEQFRVLKPGGVFLLATCLMNPLHAAPSDFWRFTPDGLKLLTKPHGELLDYGGWGNRYIGLLDMLGLRFQPIPHAKWHPLHWIAMKNQPERPLTTWVLVQKSG